MPDSCMHRFFFTAGAGTTAPIFLVHATRPRSSLVNSYLPAEVLTHLHPGCSQSGGQQASSQHFCKSASDTLQRALELSSDRGGFLGEVGIPDCLH